MVSKTIVAIMVTEGSNPSLSAIVRFWRGDRVVEGARLEIVCRVTPYRGFESLPLRHFFAGAVAQLGERQVRNLEVVGSIPICSTMFFSNVWSC